MRGDETVCGASIDSISVVAVCLHRVEARELNTAAADKPSVVQCKVIIIWGRDLLLLPLQQPTDQKAHSKSATKFSTR